jgi:hypothetical protein
MYSHARREPKTKLSPSKGAKFPVVINGYMQVDNALGRSGTFTVAENNLAGFAEIEILKILGKETFRIERQHVTEALIQLCYPIRTENENEELWTPRFDDNGFYDTTPMTIRKASATQEKLVIDAQTRPLSVESIFEHPREDYLGYTRYAINEQVLNSFGWSGNYVYEIQNRLSVEFKRVLEHKVEMREFEDAVRLYVDISLRMQYVIGRRVASSYNNSHTPTFVQHLRVIKAFLAADEAISQHFQETMNRIRTTFSPQTVNKIEQFHDNQVSKQQQMQNAIRSYESGARGFDDHFNIIENTLHSWYGYGDYITIIDNDDRMVMYTNLSLYEPLDTTIYSRHWDKIIKVASDNRMYPVFAKIYDCMHDNLYYLQNPEPEFEMDQNLSHNFDLLIALFATRDRQAVSYLWNFFASIIAQNMHKEVFFTLQIIGI